MFVQKLFKLYNIQIRKSRK